MTQAERDRLVALKKAKKKLITQSKGPNWGLPKGWLASLLNIPCKLLVEPFDPNVVIPQHNTLVIRDDESRTGFFLKE
jgi:hypothetical protein